MTEVLAVYGTRPEQIKLEPVLEGLIDCGVRVSKFWSEQSPDLLGRKRSRGPDGLLMDWSSVNAGIRSTMREVQDKAADLDVVLVAGDTATAFAAAQAAFLADVPVAHVEAGLRTYDREPWPEEAFRQAIASFATWHFCPDADAQNNVRCEIGNWDMDNHPRTYDVGNPVIDALGGPEPLWIFGTFHRRENWGQRISNALEALSAVAEDDLVDAEVITHPNWEKALERPLEAFSDEIAFLEPLEHDTFLASLRGADVVVTDSGGVQEECAALGTDCLVWRTKTERTQLERLGAVEVLDPDDPESLRDALQKRLDRRTAYGRGDAGEKIAEILANELEEAENV